MAEFKEACGAQDMLALDAFFYHWYDKKLGRKKPVAKARKLKGGTSVGSP